ncbi:phosphoribosylformylglycinamidine synthase subunit PurQ [Lacunimicrobium album]
MSTASPRVCVLRAPGTNCDAETAFAFEKAGGKPDSLHLNEFLAKRKQLKDYQILAVSGGFSFGDDIGSGVVLASKLRRSLKDALTEFLAADKLALGICNGFQTLLKAGVLPNGTSSFPPTPEARSQATLTWNENGRYTAVWVKLKTAGSNSVFLRGVDDIELPCAHAEGRIAVRDEATLKAWQDAGQIALQYADDDGATGTNKLPFPMNPNGSAWNIAGLSDPTGRVLGLMPHPERFLSATNHPQWTRRKLTGDGAGLKLFQNAVGYFA